MQVPTPHIQAEKGAVSPIVLLPGDPLRARFIARNYLKDAVLYNEVRGMFGYTGWYKEVQVSVQGTGMGAPSMGIYAHELIHGYGAKTLIRIGTAGALQPELQLRDLILGVSASFDGSMWNFKVDGTIAPTASFPLLLAAYNQAKKTGIPVHAGPILSSDTFYNEEGLESFKPWQKVGILAVEMEAAALYLTAQRSGVQALCMLTISDLPLQGKSVTSEERQTSFHTMMELALNTAIQS